MSSSEWVSEWVVLCLINLLSCPHSQCYARRQPRTRRPLCTGLARPECCRCQWRSFSGIIPRQFQRLNRACVSTTNVNSLANNAHVLMQCTKLDHCNTLRNWIGNTDCVRRMLQRRDSLQTCSFEILRSINERSKTEFIRSFDSDVIFGYTYFGVNF